MIGLLDPSIGTANAGDLIISQAVRGVLNQLNLPFASFSTRGTWDRITRKKAQQCRVFVLGGTNIITSNPLAYRQWLLGFRDFPTVRRKTVLLGVGWWQYQGAPTLLGRRFLREVLHPEVLHSVRDSYTAQKLSSLGHPAANTACPTMWSLDGLTCPPILSCRSVVATVTDYSRDAERDAFMLDLLREQFDQVVLWPQGNKDREYLSHLERSESILPNGLQALNDALQQPGTAYVGTRLHAGIAALALGAPSLIIGVDNRAIEIARDTNLPVIERAEIKCLASRLDAASGLIRLPVTDINRWRSAFKQLADF